MSTTFKVEVKDHTKEILGALSSEMGTILGAVGQQAEGYAKQNCPVDTGRLRNSITNQVEGSSVIIGSNVEYAPAIEFRDIGHRTGKAHFLRDSLQDHIKEYEELIEKGVEAALK